MVLVVNDYSAAFTCVQIGEMMADEYMTYVVRIWPGGQKRPLPKIVVENPHTGIKLSFNNWDNLALFLQSKSDSFRGGAHGKDPDFAEGLGSG